METKEKEATEELCKAADRIREHFCGREADLCTIMNAKSGSCSGGIIGMGESRADRISLAFELRGQGVESIPVDVLNPVKGTPLEKAEPLCQDVILKTIAVFRFINPKASIRLAGGRNLINEFGRACFGAGANATITGNYLTTSGNKICDDKVMLVEMGYELRH